MPSATPKSPPRLDPEARRRRDDKALAMLAAGATVAEAARAVRISRQHLYFRLAQLRAAASPKTQDRS
jgi:DNA invertase Pin-like site-specific DNA recombinase